MRRKPTLPDHEAQPIPPEALADLIEKTGLTQQALADHLGVGVRTIRRAVQGEASYVLAYSIAQLAAGAAVPPASSDFAGDPEALRALVLASGMTQLRVAAKIGKSSRAMRYALLHGADYPTHFAIKQLAARPMAAATPRRGRPARPAKTLASARRRPTKSA